MEKGLMIRSTVFAVFFLVSCAAAPEERDGCVYTYVLKKASSGCGVMCEIVGPPSPYGRIQWYFRRQTNPNYTDDSVPLTLLNGTTATPDFNFSIAEQTPAYTTLGLSEWSSTLDIEFAANADVNTSTLSIWCWFALDPTNILKPSPQISLQVNEFSQSCNITNDFPNTLDVCAVHDHDNLSPSSPTTESSQSSSTYEIPLIIVLGIVIAILCCADIVAVSVCVYKCKAKRKDIQRSTEVTQPRRWIGQGLNTPNRNADITTPYALDGPQVSSSYTHLDTQVTTTDSPSLHPQQPDGEASAIELQGLRHALDSSGRSFERSQSEHHLADYANFNGCGNHGYSTSDLTNTKPKYSPLTLQPAPSAPIVSTHGYINFPPQHHKRDTGANHTSTSKAAADPHEKPVANQQSTQSYEPLRVDKLDYESLYSAPNGASIKQMLHRPPPVKKKPSSLASSKPRRLCGKK